MEDAAAVSVTNEVVPALNPVARGLDWIAERGIDADRVAGVQLRGPKGACVGTFAEMLGTPGHEQWLSQFDASIEEARQEARDEGREIDATDAIMPWVRMSAMRDENGKIEKIDLETLKKNGGTAGQESPA